MKATNHCRVCGGTELTVVKPGMAPSNLAPENFAITDPRYGQTLPILACNACGFMQCPNVDGLLGFYQALVDPAYEEGRPQRKMQAFGILQHLMPLLDTPAGSLRLLDVGAGSGILVEAAREMGFAAQGVEPCRWLQEIAQKAGLPVLAGTIDDLPPDARFDIIVLADVIEHVETPVQLLRACAARLSPQGLLAVLTPDCRSLAARLLGWRWWHYRIAHINYFDRQTLAAALSAADLEPVRTLRPGWRFTMQYLCERLEAYVPKVLIPRFLYSKRISIPLNLRDSLMVIATKRP